MPLAWAMHSIDTLPTCARYNTVISTFLRVDLRLGDLDWDPMALWTVAQLFQLQPPTWGSSTVRSSCRHALSP